MNVAYLKMMWGLHLHFFFFSFLGAGLLMSFHGHSCPQLWSSAFSHKHEVRAGAGAGMAQFFFFFLSNWDGAPKGVGALRKRPTLRIGSGRYWSTHINWGSASVEPVDPCVDHGWCLSLTYIGITSVSPSRIFVRSTVMPPQIRS